MSIATLTRETKGALNYPSDDAVFDCLIYSDHFKCGPGCECDCYPAEDTMAVQRHCPNSQNHRNGTDERPSMSVRKSPQTGRTLVWCHSCKRRDVIWRMVEKAVSQGNWPDKTGWGNPHRKRVRKMKPTITDLYTYHDGKVRARYSDKSFRWGFTTKDGKFVPQRGCLSMYPYRIEQVWGSSPDTPVFFVEGEKDAHSLESRGLVAVTWPSRWSDSWGTFFKNRDVVVIPDNDKPGEQYALEGAYGALRVAHSVKLVHLPGLKEGQDVTDWLQGHSVDELFALISETLPFQPSRSDGIDLEFSEACGLLLTRLLGDVHRDSKTRTIVSTQFAEFTAAVQAVRGIKGVKALKEGEFPARHQTWQSIVKHLVDADRCQVFQFVEKAKGTVQTVNLVGKVDFSYPTLLRIMEDLEALELLERTQQGSGLSDIWKLTDFALSLLKGIQKGVWQTDRPERSLEELEKPEERPSVDPSPKVIQEIEDTISGSPREERNPASENSQRNPVDLDAMMKWIDEPVGPVDLPDLNKLMASR